MIRIDRESVAVPEALQGPQPRYDKQEVREALSKMQHEKCCYCEKWIATTGQGQAVEHFRPQSLGKYPELKNEWTNLLHACSDCNGAKGGKFPLQEDGTPLLIDPSDPAINPEDHITFDVNDEEDATFARAKAKNDSPIGAKTIEVIKLDITPRRRDRKKTFIELLRAYGEILEADTATRPSKIATFQALLGANYPHAAFARVFARKKKLEERYSVQIPEGADYE